MLFSANKNIRSKNLANKRIQICKHNLPERYTGNWLNEMIKRELNKNIYQLMLKLQPFYNVTAAFCFEVLGRIISGSGLSFSPPVLKCELDVFIALRVIKELLKFNYVTQSLSILRHFNSRIKKILLQRFLTER